MGRPGGEETLDSVLKVMSDPVCGVTTDGRITLWNEAAAAAFGYSRPEATGEHVAQLLGIDDHDRDLITELTARALDTEAETAEATRIELTKANGTRTAVDLRPVARRDGSILWLFEAGSKPSFEPVDGPPGEPAIYRRAVEESADMVAAADYEERLLFANERYREFHGIDGPVEGQPVSDVLPMSVYDEMQPRIEKVLSGETLQFELERVDANGVPHDLDGRYYPIRNADGRIEAAVASIRDVTELKNRATALREAWETYSDLVEGTPDPIVLFDGDGAILEVNRAACQLLGQGERTLLEQPFDDLLYEGRSEWIDDRIQAGDDEVIFEAEFVTDTGRSVPVEIAATGIDYFGTQAVLTVARDLTDRKEYERQLEAANARLEEFAAVLTQDLRNPLTVARGWTDLARDGDREEALDRISDSLDRMEEVIDYTYTVAREGENIGQLSTVDLGTVVEQSWHAVGPDGALENELDRSVRGDPGRLSYLFETLFRSCAAHVDDALSIQVDSLPVRDGFFVANDGADLPLDERMAGSAHVGGSGGPEFELTAIKRIADAHGWQLRIRESERDGVRFEFHDVEFAQGEAN